MRDDLVVALTDAALHIDFLAHVQEVVTTASDDGKGNNNDEDVGKGKELLLLNLLGIHVFDLGGRHGEVSLLALHGDGLLGQDAQHVVELNISDGRRSKFIAFK